MPRFNPVHPVQQRFQNGFVQQDIIPRNNNGAYQNIPAMERRDRQGPVIIGGYGRANYQQVPPDNNNNQNSRGVRQEEVRANPNMTLEEKLNVMATGTRQSNLMGGVASNIPMNPIDIRGDFARSMTQITGNPSSTSQGTVSRSIELNDQLNKQIQMALAINLGLNGPQAVKERALHDVLTSKSARGDVKQILQSRAEIYGDTLDPN